MQALWQKVLINLNLDLYLIIIVVFFFYFCFLGLVYDSNTTVKDPTKCSTVSCSMNGIATEASDCGPLEDCDGNGR